MKPNEKKFDCNHDGRLVIAGLLRSVFRLVCADQRNKDSLEVTVTPGTQPESAAPVISDDQGSSSLSWIQAGVFAQESSVRELTAFLEQDGFTPVTYTRGEYKIVAVGVSLNPEVTRQCRQRMIDLDYEWMERACSLNETQRQQLSQGQTASVLEGCTSQP